VHIRGEDDAFDTVHSPNDKPHANTEGQRCLFAGEILEKEKKEKKGKYLTWQYSQDTHV